MTRWALLVVLAATGCHGLEPADRGAAPLACGAATTALVQRPPRTELPTTNAADFLRGLDGQIVAAERLVIDDPSSSTKRIMLASLLGARGKLAGDLDELERAIELLPGDEPASLIERASLHQTLHRFPAAHADLSRARALGAAESALVPVEQELDWNEGRYEAAIAKIRNPAKRTMMTVLRQARLQHDLGDDAGADRLFAEAEDLIDDTSPVPVAFLNFQRGFHAFEIGRLEEAAVFYREALRRLPGWITAQEHLAEVLVLQGRGAEAAPLYEDVVSRSRDPELAAALSDLYRALGRDPEPMLARARAGFDEYARRFPEAAYGHGSEFYLGSGNDPLRALAMREANVRLRPNGLTHAQLAEARLITGDLAGARAAADLALASPLGSASLFWTAARVYAALGERARAAALAQAACARNPRASIDEPAIEP